jgi:hypothetical protein
VGIAENPRDGRTRAEPGKAIRIPQPARASGHWHAAIIVDSRAAAATFPTAARAGFLTLSPLFSPTHFHEEPEKRRGPGKPRPLRCGVIVYFCPPVNF